MKKTSSVSALAFVVGVRGLPGGSPGNSSASNGMHPRPGTATGTRSCGCAFVIDNGTPTIAELAARKKGGAWGVVAANVTPDAASRPAGAALTTKRRRGCARTASPRSRPRSSRSYQWDPFWDAPLFVPGGTAADTRTLGLPRKPEEVHRGTATYKASSCEVKTDKTHLTVSFPASVTLGVFNGDLQFTVYKGSNLIQQEVIASTMQNSVAYSTTPASRGCRSPTAAWRGAIRSTCRSNTGSAGR